MSSWFTYNLYQMNMGDTWVSLHSEELNYLNQFSSFQLQKPSSIRPVGLWYGNLMIKINCAKLDINI